MNWDDEAEVVILGFGAAGAAAALAANELGGSVILVEKQSPEAPTPNIRMSGGAFMASTNSAQTLRYLEKCAGGVVEREPLAALAEQATRLKPWMEQQCPDLPFTYLGGAEHPEFEGAEAIKVYQVGKPKFRLDPEAATGKDLFDHLRFKVESLPVRIRWRTRARRLIQEEGGKVIGVEVDDGETKRIRATKGVVLATGGFEYDELAKKTYLAAPMHFYGNRANEGDGLRMAQAAGADMWHMSQVVGRAVGNFELEDGSEQAFFISIAPPGYVLVDGDGERFANEDPQAFLTHSFYHELIKFDTERGIFPRVPCYWLFDEKRRGHGPLSPLKVGARSVGLYDWSDDNSREIDRGWIARGETTAEAARNAGHEFPEVVERSVAEFNAGCRRGSDPFGRDGKTLIPLENPPYYCVKLYPGGSNTTGGPRRDSQARVLDPWGSPIEGLYGAGELGQVSGRLYASDGFNLCEAFCYGRIAAASALGKPVPL